MVLPSLTIAIPAYNEHDSLSDVVADALRVGKTVTSKLEILIVDDGSTDGTSELIDQLAKQHKEITPLHHKKNQGFSGAIKSCYTQSKNEWIFLSPADGQIKMDDLVTFAHEAPSYDLLVGYRLKNPEPMTRRINSFCFHTLYRFLFGVHLKEISTVIMWRKVFLDTLPITAQGRSALIEPEVVYQAVAHKARIREIGITYFERKTGKAKGSDPRMILITIKELFRLWYTLRVRLNTTS